MVLEILELASLAVVPAFLLLDLRGGRRIYDAPRWWKARGFLVSAATLAWSIAIALFWGNVFRGVSLLHLDGLGTVGGAAAGVLVYNVLLYAYHRAAHRFDWLWRAAHQMHHSPESIDAFGALYAHPLDTLVFTTWSSLAFFPLLGVTPLAGAAGAAFISFNSMFQHMNRSTPYWLGFVIQRPESHCIHHARGLHRSNYCDLPVLDILFGTFENPRSVEGRLAGFYPGASSRIGEMILCRDVSEPEPAGKVVLESIEAMEEVA
jgi:sterol desaturase/sphingolipid hydroxylase (fatty acid hydroxylase superfamily)